MQQNSGGMPFGLSGRRQYRLRSVASFRRAFVAGFAAFVAGFAAFVAGFAAFVAEVV